MPGKREPDAGATDHTPQPTLTDRGKGGHWVLAVGIAVLLGVGIWAVDQVSPGMGQVWPAWQARGASWAQETLLWFEFFGSIILSVLALLWFTGLLFGLLVALVYLLTRLAGSLAARFPSSALYSQIEQWVLSLVQYDRVLGTVLNLVACAGSLGVLAWIVGRSLDYWDLGIQAAIFVVMELIVLGVLFGEGRIGLLARG